MRHTVVLLAITAAAASTAAVATPNAAASASAGAATTLAASHHRVHPGLHGIPSGAPAAAYRKEPRLPHPKHHQWPFGSNAFPQTSGSGREQGGATYWSDFIDDAYGAAAAQGEAGTSTVPVSTLAPTQGAYSYPAKDEHGDGADIFRSAVGLTRKATYWRVDWNTLTNRRVPIAEWTFDTDNSTATGATAWPANAGVNSPGIDKALVVSAKGAELIKATSGKVIHHFHTMVNMRSRSFVVRIPRRVLPVRNTWRVRLAAGLADPAGTGFAAAGGKEPGQPNVYNVTFRSVSQEPPVYIPSGDDGDGSGVGLLRGVKYGNYWMEAHQSNALAHSDVSAFSLPIVWRQLAHKARTPQPMPTGYSVRWYVSPLHLGQGIISNATNEPAGDLKPNYLGRVQPYAVYVPTDYTPHRKFPLTWILHSLSVNYNQYGALDPAMIQQECEDRDSICATTEGFGPDGWYYDAAEVDFWNVWHQVAKTYTLDPTRTVISGYSMGGFASYKLGLAYPDLFAKAMPLAGPPACGERVVDGVGTAGGPGHCTTDGDTTPMIHNATWLPYILGDGGADELVPVTSVLQQVDKFLNLGLRIHFELYPAEDHLVFATQDGFSSEIAQLGNSKRKVNPGKFTYSWYPSLSNKKLGIGTTGDYWVRGLSARDRKPGEIATIKTNDGMRPAKVHAVEKTTHTEVPGDPTPAEVIDQFWKPEKRPALKHRLRLHLTDVKSAGIDMSRTRLHHGHITVTSDGRSLLRLMQLTHGARVTRAGHVVGRARHGRLVIHVHKGMERLHLNR